jgi:AcrR family transcriptional regulator
MIGKTAILDSAQRLIAARDYESVAVSEIARGARCSVGVIYCRFANKEALFAHLSGAAFQQLTTESRAYLEQHVLAAGEAPRRAVEYAVRQLSAPRIAGVVRMTVKVGFTRPSVLKPLEDYRRAFSAAAAAAIGGNENGVRRAMQTVLAAITDSIVTGIAIAGGTDTLAGVVEAFAD